MDLTKNKLLRPTRRRLLAQLSASAFIAATHGAVAWSSRPRNELPAPEPDAEARIQHLRLQTTTPLAEMQKFYCDRIGMPLVAGDDEEITFAAGPTHITFVLSEKSEKGDPFYHVAFNIPENKHELSKQWLIDERIDIHRVFHFRHWNAHAVFFLDPADNLLEFIARHDLKNAAAGGFAPEKDILCASEIAFIVDDVPAFASTLKEALGLGDYRPGTDAFATPGDEHGLLLVFKRGRQWHKPAETFPAVVRIAGDQPASFTPADYPYEIRTR